MQPATHTPTDDRADDDGSAHPDIAAAAVAQIAAHELRQGQARAEAAMLSPLDQSMRRSNPRPAAMPVSVWDMGRDTLQTPSATLSPVNITGADDYAEDHASAVASVVSAMEAMHAAASKVIESRDAIKFDDTLTPAAQLLAIDAMQEKLWPAATRKVDAANAWLTQAIAAEEKALRAPMRENATGHYAAEMRALVRGMSAGERMKFLTAAIAEGDSITAGAVLGGAPPALSGLDAQMASALTEQWQRARNPDAVRRLNMMKSAQARMERAANVFITTREGALGARFETVAKLRDRQQATRRVTGAIA